MPLIKSKSDKAFKKNVATEVKAGKPVKQAVAIAYSTKRAAKKAVGGYVESARDDDYDDYDAPPRTRYRPAPDARHYDSDIDYYTGSSSKPQSSFPKPPKVSKEEKERKDKMVRKSKADTSTIAAAYKAGDKEAAEKAFVRRHARERSEGLRRMAKLSPNSAPKMRKQWSEEIGGGKPAPFKSGGKAKSSW